MKTLIKTLCTAFALSFAMTGATMTTELSVQDAAEEMPSVEIKIAAVKCPYRWETPCPIDPYPPAPAPEPKKDKPRCKWDMCRNTVV